MKVTVFEGWINSTAPFLSKFNGTEIQWYADDMVVSAKGDLVIPIKGLNKEHPKAVTDVLLSEVRMRCLSKVEVKTYLTDDFRVLPYTEGIKNVLRLKEKKD